jgi:hypothetical protein
MKEEETDLLHRILCQWPLPQLYNDDRVWRHLLGKGENHPPVIVPIATGKTAPNLVWKGNREGGCSVCLGWLPLHPQHEGVQCLLKPPFSNGFALTARRLSSIVREGVHGWMVGDGSVHG